MLHRLATGQSEGGIFSTNVPLPIVPTLYQVENNKNKIPAHGVSSAHGRIIFYMNAGDRNQVPALSQQGTC